MHIDFIKTSLIDPTKNSTSLILNCDILEDGNSNFKKLRFNCTSRKWNFAKSLENHGFDSTSWMYEHFIECFSKTEMFASCGFVRPKWKPGRRAQLSPIENCVGLLFPIFEKTEIVRYDFQLYIEKYISPTIELLPVKDPRYPFQGQFKMPKLTAKVKWNDI